VALPTCGKVAFLRFDFSPSAINGAWGASAWDAINGAQADEDKRETSI